jgi:hypothetical protein
MLPSCPRCGERLEVVLSDAEAERAVPVVTVATYGEQTGARSANLVCCPHCGAAVGVLPVEQVLPQQP